MRDVPKLKGMCQDFFLKVQIGYDPLFDKKQFPLKIPTYSKVF